MPVREKGEPPSTGRLTVNLDHLRWMAAMMVVVQHCRGFVVRDYSPSVGPLAKAAYFATGFSHQAVVIFFVISGYLVGGKAVRIVRRGASDAQAKRFLIDRAARILVVLWPALALAALVAAVAPDTPILHSATWMVGLPDVRGTATGASWAAAPVLLNELLAPTVNWDNPLWSLAFEWAYYMFAVAALFLAARARTPMAILICAYAAILVALSAWARPTLLAMFPFWLAGAAASQVRNYRLPAVSIGFMLVALLASRVPVMPWPQDALVATATAVLLADGWFRDKQPAPAVGHSLAAFSYSLYAMHFPVMLLAVAAIQSAGYLPERLPAGLPAYGLVLALVAIAYAAAWTFAQLTERQTDRARAFLSRLTLGRSPQPVTAAGDDVPVSAELENAVPPLRR